MLTIMRENTTKSKYYMLICRNAFSQNQDSFVDLQIQLPGILKKAKFILYMREKYEPAQDDAKFFTGHKAEIIEDFELRKFCDIFYE